MKSPKATIGPTKRRVSKAVPPQMSVEPVQSSPSTSNQTHGTKRPHDDNTSIGAGPATGSSSTVPNGPSPKRPKTEWDSAPSEALRKKNEAIDSIKSEEDASEVRESLSLDISNTAEMILELESHGPIPDISGDMPLWEPESSTTREPWSPPPKDSFNDFFDFSFGEDDENNSRDLVSCSSTDPSPNHGLSSSSAMYFKTEEQPLRLGTWKETDHGGATMNNSRAPTPDLVSCSSTTPSPPFRVTHEVDAANHGLSDFERNRIYSISKGQSSSSVYFKTEELEQPDHLRLGTWKETDHGEATLEWKWDSPMPSHESDDSPWAIFNSYS